MTHQSWHGDSRVAGTVGGALGWALLKAAGLFPVVRPAGGAAPHPASAFQPSFFARTPPSSTGTLPRPDWHPPCPCLCWNTASCAGVVRKKTAPGGASAPGVGGEGELCRTPPNLGSLPWTLGSLDPPWGPGLPPGATLHHCLHPGRPVGRRPAALPGLQEACHHGAAA